MRRLVAAASAVLAVVAVAPAASAAPLLVLRATRPGWIDLTVPNAFDLDSWSISIRSTGGRYGGVFAYRLGQPYADDSDHFAMIFGQRGGPGGDPDRATGVAARAALLRAPAEKRYQGGRYRFVVLTEHPVEIRIPLAGLARPVTVGVPARPAVRVAYAVAGGTTTGPVTEARAPFVVTRRTAAMTLGHLDWRGAAAHDNAPCFALPGGPCDPRAGMPMSGQTGSAGEESMSLFAGPGELADGPWDGVARTATTGEVELVGYVVAFEVP